jgi:hypothetical protein
LILYPVPGFFWRGAQLCSRCPAGYPPVRIGRCILADEGTDKPFNTRFDPSEKATVRAYHNGDLAFV